MQDSPLLERYAQRLRLSPEAARRRLFYECVPRWQRGFVRLHSRLRPRLYACDWRLVHEAGLATTLQGVADAFDRWQHCAPLVSSWGRDRLHWRISGRRLLTLARVLLAEDTARTAKPARRMPVALEHARAAVKRNFTVNASEWVRLHG